MRKTQSFCIVAFHLSCPTDRAAGNLYLQQARTMRLLSLTKTVNSQDIQMIFHEY